MIFLFLSLILLVYVYSRHIHNHHQNYIDKMHIINKIKQCDFSSSKDVTQISKDNEYQFIDKECIKNYDDENVDSLYDKTYGEYQGKIKKRI